MSCCKSLFALLLLTACGFQPLYAKKSEESTPGASLGKVAVEVQAENNRNVQLLKASLEDSLNPNGVIPSDPDYILRVGMVLSEGAIGVARDGSTSRYNLYLDSRYILVDKKTGKQLTQGNIRQVGSFNNVSNAYFSTYIAEADAIKRGIAELAEMYRQRLESFRADHPSL